MAPETLAQALESVCRRWPERVALVDRGRRLRYAELDAAIAALARAYPQLGIGGGERIVCSLSNRAEQIIALGAAWRSGAVHVGVDYQSTAAELSAVIGLTQASALIYEPSIQSADTWATLHALRRDHPDLRVLVVGEHAAPEGCLALAELIAMTEAPRLAGEHPNAPSAHDPALIFISSGTTGTPKAALGYHGNLCQRWQRLAGWLRFGPEDTHLAHLPLAHGFGLMMAVAGLLGGGRLALLAPFSAEPALHLIEQERVTVLNGAPTHFKLILRRLEQARHDLSSLRLSVGTASFFPAPLVQAIWDQLGVEFMFMYGSSEGLGVATTDRDDILRGSVGRPAPGSVAIVGPDHRPLATDQVGEIAFSRSVFPVRYWRGPASVAPPADDNHAWYYSGDLGRLDEQGRLYVFGRLKHQIDRGGLKVDPVEVEGALLRCPGVFDAAVIGVPDPILGEIVCACVVPESAPAPSLEQLRAALSAELAPFKLPEELCVLERIPRTQIGKVDLARLRTDVLALAREQIRRG